ncbi:MAG TPA: lipocalin-like domain-containing protein, partial [Candidatus Eisenbacteria bacterium]|nr:lipocalin-like domain-containing protein [Candidatus Eisenbacteria bacterium]
NCSTVVRNASRAYSFSMAAPIKTNAARHLRRETHARFLFRPIPPVGASLSLDGKTTARAKRKIAAALVLCCALLFSGFTYQVALPGRKLSFPADHYAHPDYRTEWWYYTGHLQTVSGRRFGYQVTFFRFGLRDRQEPADWPPLFTDLYMAHFALSDLNQKRFLFKERINRGYRGRAGAATDRYHVWNEDWEVRGEGAGHWIRVRTADDGLALRLTSLKPPALHGRDGLSQKAEGEGRASYYYSLTRMLTEGEITAGGKTEKVRGLSWMDHEFGSNQLSDDQVGWDWFSIQLEDGTEFMLYLIRRRDGTIDPYSSGTIVDRSGATRHLSLKDFKVEVLDHWKSRRSGARYPMRWSIMVPSAGAELLIAPEFPEQELVTNRSTRVTYWEGAVRISGAVAGKAVAGHGYVEMTGYAGRVTI